MKATLCIAAALLIATPAMAQVHVQAGGATVDVDSRDGDDDRDINVDAKDITAISTGGNSASVNVGTIGGNANIQGVTVINGRVSIDGKEIPPNVTRYKSPRTGQVYIITRKGGSVDVKSEPEKRK